MTSNRSRYYANQRRRTSMNPLPQYSRPFARPDHYQPRYVSIYATIEEPLTKPAH